MAKGFSVGQELAVGAGTPPVNVKGFGVKAFGESFGRQAPGISRALQQRQEYSGLSERQRLEKAANPRDITDIEAFAAAFSDLTEERRATELAKIRKSVDVISVPLLEWHVKNAGKAAEPTFETQIPKEYKTQVTQALMGRRPGAEHELELGQLPPGERAGALTKRLAPLETIAPGLGKEAGAFIPTGEERVLSPIEAARQRAREAKTKGRTMADVQAALKEITPGMLPWEKVAIVDDAMAKGILDEIGYAAAKTYLNDKEVPEWLATVPESMYSQLGIKKDKDGTLSNDISDSAMEATTQVNLRAVFSTEIGIKELNQFSSSELDRMKMAAYGEAQLSDTQATAIEKETSDLSRELIVWVKDPAISLKPDDPKFLERIYSLIRLFGVEGAAAVLTMAMDTRMRSYLGAGGVGAGAGG